MKITSAEFTRGIKGSDPILGSGIPQAAFIGRSNVGKSSVINSLVGRKDLAKSSATPGKTREINFFLINENLYFVDLPGYGFAKMSQKQSDKLRKMILWYFTAGEANPKLVVLIIDAKVGLTALDMEMLEILKGSGLNVIVLANKIDKLKKNDIKKRVGEIQERSGFNVLPYSAIEKINVKELLSLIIS